MTSVVALRFTGPAPVMTQTFEEIYAEQLDYVWHSLRRLGVDDRDREDLAHDVFLVVYRRLASYDPACSLRAWLFGIAYRVVADPVSYTHLRAHETPEHLVCRLL